MNKVIAGLMATMLLAPLGCNQSTTPGGPGATTTPSTSASGTPSTTANRPAYGEAEGTFNISTPTLSTRLKQGETKTATISLSRGKNFDEDVALKLDDIPQGLTVDPASPMIMHGDKEATINLHAAADAALGDFTIKVLGHPTKGADASSVLKVTIVAP